MKALDAVKSMLGVRPAGRHRQVSRYTFSDYASWVAQSMLFNGHQYGLEGAGYTTTYGRTPAEPIGNSFEGYATGLLYSDGPVAAVEAFRLRVFSQAPPLFQSRSANGRPGDLYDHESLDLLNEPWPGGTCSDLMKRALIQGDIGGNAYITLIDGELVLLRPDWVDILLAKREYEGYQVGWKQVGIAYYEGGKGLTSDPAIFLPGEYAHFVPGLPDPLATYRGMSWLTPVIREVQGDKSASDHKLKFFENAATPNLAVSLPKEVTPAQFTAYVDKMAAGHDGVENAYKTLYVGGGADVTVIGQNMQQMDFGSVQGKIETRIANAGGVPPVLLSFSEGMQGSSLNAGNYTPAKRNFVDTTGRDLWSNWYGSMQVLVPPPKPRDRLTYDPRDIPFLHEDQTDVAQIKQIEAATMNTLVTAGWEKASIISAVTAGDWTLLKDTGLVSVQLLPPGETGQPASDAGPKASAARAHVLSQVVRKFNPDQPRIPGGHEGGGRWGTLGGVSDSLHLLGRIDLNDNEELIGSGGIDADGGGFRIAALDRNGVAVFRVGFGGEGYGEAFPDDDIPDWDGNPSGGGGFNQTAEMGDAALEALTGQINSGLTSAAANPDAVDVEFVRGVVPGDRWGDVHYQVYQDEPESGPRVVVGVLPKGDPGWRDGRDWDGIYDAARWQKILRIIGQMRPQ